MSEGWSYAITAPAGRDMRRLPVGARDRILTALRGFAETGVGDMQKLTDREGEWRLRVGGYRVIFERNPDERLIVVLHILPRGRAYRGG